MNDSIFSPRWARLCNIVGEDKKSKLLSPGRDFTDHTKTFLGRFSWGTKTRCTIHKPNIQTLMKAVYKFMNNISLPIASNSFQIRENIYNLLNFQQLANTEKSTVKWIFLTVDLSHWVLFQMKWRIPSLFHYLKIILKNAIYTVPVSSLSNKNLLIFLSMGIWEW